MTKIKLPELLTLNGWNTAMKRAKVSSSTASDLNASIKDLNASLTELKKQFDALKDDFIAFNELNKIKSSEWPRLRSDAIKAKTPVIKALDEVAIAARLMKKTEEAKKKDCNYDLLDALDKIIKATATLKDTVKDYNNINALETYMQTAIEAKNALLSGAPRTTCKKAFESFMKELYDVDDEDLGPLSRDPLADLKRKAREFCEACEKYAAAFDPVNNTLQDDQIKQAKPKLLTLAKAKSTVDKWKHKDADAFSRAAESVLAYVRAMEDRMEKLLNG